MTTSVFHGICLGLVVEHMAQQLLPTAKKKRDRQRAELALYGTSVACIESRCSNCQESRTEHSCECKVWTCKCPICCFVRPVYSTIQNAVNASTGMWLYKVAPEHSDAMLAKSTHEVCGALPAIAMVSKECLAIFRTYYASPVLQQVCQESMLFSSELFLYGTSVGCAEKACSLCMMPQGACACKVWTCRCSECLILRKIYKQIAGTPKDVMFYHTLDDSRQDK